MMKYLFALYLTTTAALSLANTFSLGPEETNPETEEVLIKKPEKYLRNESVIYDFNTDLGIKDQRQYTGADKNRFSLAGHVSGDYEHLNEILGFELNYMRRSDKYNRIWYGIQFFQHNTYFDAITQNHDPSNSTNPNAEAKMTRPNHTKATLLAGGLGAGYRFKLLMDFFMTENVFESIDVFVNYINMDETFIDRRYAGYGLTTNYGIHKRAGSSYFYGGKISYNIASVTREALGTESKADRSFALGWLSLGLELGLFF